MPEAAASGIVVYVSICRPKKADTVWASLYSPLAGDLRVRRQKQHQAQHIPLAENRRRHSHRVTVAAVGDGQRPPGTLILINAALFHNLSQGVGQRLAQQLPLAGAGDGDDGVSVGHGGGKAAAAVEHIAELCCKILQPADQGVFLKMTSPSRVV